MSTFSEIAEKWKLSIDEQLALLGHPSRSTYFKWKKTGGILPYDTEQRISHIFRIHEALRILFPNEQAAYSWIQKPNAGPLFGNGTALDFMIREGHVGLHKTHMYLAAQRGGWA